MCAQADQVMVLASVNWDLWRIVSWWIAAEIWHISCRFLTTFLVFLQDFDRA